MKQPAKRQKAGAQREILLVVGSSTHGPWCNVHYVKAIEIKNAQPTTAIRIRVKGIDDAPEQLYIHKGPGMKPMNIPRGQMKVERIKGVEPITVVAHCGP